MCRPIPIQEAGTVVHIQRTPQPPGKVQIHPGTNRVALIMIKKTKWIFIAHFIRDQATGHPAAPLRILMRVDKMELCATADSRRGSRRLPSVNAGALKGERKED